MKILARVLAVWSTVLLPIIVAVSANQIFQSQRDLPAQIDESGEVSIRVDRLHTIRLDSDGAIRGQFHGGSSSGRLTIQVSRNGQILGRARVHSQNEFVVTNLTPGLATFAVAGSDGFAIFGLDILEWQPYEPSNSIQSLEFGIVTERFGSAKIFVDQQRQVVSYEPEVDDHEIIGGNKFFLEQNRLRGRIWDANKRLATDSSVAIFDQGEPIGLTRTDENGNFELENLKAGIYDLAVRGSDGIAALRIELFEKQQNEFDTGQQVKPDQSQPPFEIMLARVTQTQTMERVLGMAEPAPLGIGPAGLVIGVIPLIDDGPIVVPPPQSPMR